MAEYGVVIPVYNADGYLPELLERISSLNIPNLEVLIVDDGSEKPVEVAKYGSLAIHIVRHAENTGKGSALKNGFAYFLKYQTIRAVITIDADLQHTPELIPEFIRLFEQGGGDLVIGTRKRDPKTMPLHRIASNAITTGMISRMIGQPAFDSQCGFRLYSREILSAIHPTEKRFHLESEYLIRSGWAGFRIASVLIPTIYNGAPSAIRNLPDTLNFISLICRLSIERMRSHV